MKYPKLILLSAALLVGITANAGPARPYPVKVTRPDGSVVEVRYTGDEFNHVAKDMDGNVISRCIDLERRSKANEIRERRRSARRLSAATGSAMPKVKHCVVILAELTDVPLTYTVDDIKAVFTEPGYSKDRATGSVQDYFNEQFAGECSFEFVIGPQVKLPCNQAYYGANRSTGGDKNPEKAVYDACMAAHRLGFDFSPYDDDGDGEVDNVFVIMSGADEADGGGSDAIWGHQYYIYDGAGIDLVLDGLRINTYTMCTELSKRTSTRQFGITTIGVLCHEYGHSFGLKDMYDVDGTGSGGSADGLWGTGIMDTGCYLNDGNTPAHYNAVDYDTVGCGDCEELVNGEYTLEPISSTRKYLKAEGSNEGEYYLFECRKKEGWDKYTGGYGLAIYHVDHSQNDIGFLDSYGPTKAIDAWNLDAVNNRPDHQCADMIEPMKGIHYASQAFFPYNDVNSFTPAGTPSFEYWNGEPSLLAITDISIDDNGNAVFKASDSGALLIPEMTDLHLDAFQNEAQLSFVAAKEGFSGSAVMDVFEDGSDKAVFASEFQAWSGEQFAIRIEGLAPGTHYTAKVHFRNGAISGDDVTVEFSTLPLAEDSEAGPYICVTEDRTKTPLVLMDEPSGSSVRWYFNGKSIFKTKSGYYEFKESGVLKAVITYSNGDVETLYKKIAL